MAKRLPSFEISSVPRFIALSRRIYQPSFPPFNASWSFLTFAEFSRVLTPIEQINLCLPFNNETLTSSFTVQVPVVCQQSQSHVLFERDEKQHTRLRR